MTKMRMLWLAGACLVGASPALAQQIPLSSYMTSLAPAGSVIGTERMFAQQTGVWKTLTPYQILSGISGDCSMASPPSIVCTKSNGITFAPSATTDTTNASNISTGTLGLPRLALTSAFFYVGNGLNNPAGVAMSGDCTLANTGAVTCLKAGGVTLAPSATTDTTNASNITSGTLANGRSAAVNLAAGNVNGGVTGVLPFANNPTGSLDTVLGYWSTATLSATAIPNCTSGALQYNTTTHAFSCNVGAGAGTVTSAQVAAGVGIAVSGTCTITTTGVCTVASSLSSLANSLGADVLLNNTSNFFDGPNVSQGTVGTWFASGIVTLIDTGASSTTLICKLWDGATIIASTVLTAAANQQVSMSLSGSLATPAGNIKISCRDLGATTGKIEFNASGTSKDSAITAFRIQ